MKLIIKKYWYINNVCGIYGILVCIFFYMGNVYFWRIIIKYIVIIKWKVLNSYWIICYINVFVLNDMVFVCESLEVD